MFILSLLKNLTRHGPASTFIRLFNSRHVADLQLIFLSSIVLMIFGVIFAYEWQACFPSSVLISSGGLISAIVAAGCSVSAWCYVTGSSRLGVVDLFSCEIATICKAITITETVANMVEMLDAPPPQSMKFSSVEEYSPIFNNNNKDLETLEARVIGPVTEFYTYLKSMRDYLRRLGDLDKPNNNVQAWQSGIANVMYVLFLMLESARKSINGLIEFEPDQTENEIIILLSELVAYNFLVKFYVDSKRIGHDARLERLRLRRVEYIDLAENVYKRTVASNTKSEKEKLAWQKVVALLDELDQKCLHALGERINSVVLDTATATQIVSGGDTDRSTASLQRSRIDEAA